MSKLKRLATISDNIIETDSPFSLEEINQRNKLKTNHIGTNSLEKRKGNQFNVKSLSGVQRGK